MTAIAKKVVIVGGGPAGSAAAKALADQGGYEVHIYEAYEHPAKILNKTSSKAYVIALNRRGQEGISDLTGIDPLSQIPGALVSTSLARHPTGPAREKDPATKIMKHDERRSLIVPRQALALTLLDEAERAGATLHFEQRLVSVNFETRVATFQSKSGDKTSTVDYDLLIGADGSKSKVRSLMAEQKLDGFTVRTEEDSMEYQVVVLPGQPFEGEFPENTVHAWNNKAYNAICLGFPLVTKDTMLAIVFPEGKLEEFRTVTGYTDALNAMLPDIVVDDERRVELEKQLREGQIANGGLCVWASALSSPKHGVLLLGDSGHGMWPSLGQGANCALESVAVFSKCLKTAKSQDSTNWTRDLCQAFHDARYEDATAAVQLTYGGMGSRKSRGRQNSPLSYKLQIGGMMLLHKLTAGIVPKPALLRLMGGSDSLSYSKAHAFNFYYEKAICLGFLATVVAVPTLLLSSWPRQSRK